ncbi:hypothetical protein HYDPIDRAFT_33778 [Hydnomerulius pinastri MD-312]|uniref:Uncharacterized protein n=1 Tax=Hydnomerulius pinastri MD-312 TaxID=994086 RepID=A0A0C9VME8_9AGAM|nr:hypothetical protein HYDPIDRAFT_33778 [Hydnomerulius pinastri MD-312]
MELSDSIDTSVTAVKSNWTYNPQGGDTQNSTTTTFYVECSLDVEAAVSTLNLPSNQLSSSALAQAAGAPKRKWSVWSPSGSPNVGTGVSTALSHALSVGGKFFQGPRGPMFTNMDDYLNTLLGLNLTANNAASKSQSSSDPSVMLTPDQMEEAVSQMAAQLIWAAGQAQYQHIAASAASFVLLVLASYMVRRFPPRPAHMSGVGVLEALWLEAHSQKLHESFEDIRDPSTKRLRAAGMFDICLAESCRLRSDGAEGSDER